MATNLVIADLMPTTFDVLPSTTLVREARQLASSSAVIVVVANQQPVGIVPVEALVTLADETQPLAIYQDQFKLPTLTNPDTSLSMILSGMHYDKFIRWHVVQAAGSIIGVVSSTEIFRALPEKEPETYGNTNPGSSIPGGLFGDPFIKVGCYRCTKDSTHAFRPLDVQRTTAGRAICSFDQAPLIAENPCTGNL